MKFLKYIQPAALYFAFHRNNIVGSYFIFPAWHPSAPDIMDQLMKNGFTEFKNTDIYIERFIIYDKGTDMGTSMFICECQEHTNDEQLGKTDF